MPVSLRVPEEMNRRIAKVANALETSAHSFMLEAIRDRVAAEEEELAFRREAEARLTSMKDSGKGIAAREAFAFLEAKAQGKKRRRPVARRVP